METERRIASALREAVSRATGASCPPGLVRAIEHAVFPGGGRIRPRLVLSVAGACGDRWPPLADAAAVAIELLHCASLVHDDMPCFDDAAVRRGRPSVHRAFGEQLALLAGDALIVVAFDTLGRAVPHEPRRAAGILASLARGVGPAGGLVAGQAWESEPGVELDDYHGAKTAALFEAAVVAGALAGGGDGTAWRDFGRLFGRAYQTADDLADLIGDADALGKPVGQDARQGRPNTAIDLGIDQTLSRLSALVRTAVRAVPLCPGRKELSDWIARSVGRFLPPDLGGSLHTAVRGSR